METVLIIDDSKADQFLSKCLIENHDPNISVMQAFDGQEALDLLAEMDKEPDIIITDINMPRMNGYDFLETYSQRNNIQSKIYILTSSNQKADRELSERFDCVTDFIIKPITKDVLNIL